jgi:transposase
MTSHFGRVRNRAVTPTRAADVPDPACDRDPFRERTVVERLISRLTQWRRIATPYEKRAANDRALRTLAAILRWL